MGAELHGLSAREIRKRLRMGALRVVDVAEHFLAKIEARDREIQAWAYVDPQSIRAAARALDADRSPGPLHGLPLGVKDIFDTFDAPTRYGSPIYRSNAPIADAACVARARDAGALVFGKTATTEFATYAPAATVNPHNSAHTPGGSSSGSAAAVADGMVPFAFGTQTAGSIIRPASYCGTIGYKPSYGMIARAGVKLVAESLDTIGVFARFVEDAALLVGALTGRADLTELGVVDGPVRIGICHTRDWEYADADVAKVLAEAALALAAAGARTVTAEMPADFDALGEAFDSIYGYEIVQSLAHENRAHRNQLSAQLREMLDICSNVTPEAYDLARATADDRRRRLAAVFGDCDVLLAPSACGEAPSGLGNTGSPVLDRIWTLLHVPCVNVPAGVGARGLPIGLQVVGRYGDDAKALRAAAWVARTLAHSPAIEGRFG